MSSIKHLSSVKMTKIKRLTTVKMTKIVLKSTFYVGRHNIMLNCVAGYHSTKMFI
jgi:hypothetical protein